MEASDFFSRIPVSNGQLVASVCQFCLEVVCVARTGEHEPESLEAAEALHLPSCHVAVRMLGLAKE